MSTLQACKHVLWCVCCFYIPDFITLFGPVIFTFYIWQIISSTTLNVAFLLTRTPSIAKCLLSCLPSLRVGFWSKWVTNLTDMLNTDLNQLGDSAEGDGEGEDNDNGLTGKSYRLFIGYSNIKKL